MSMIKNEGYCTGWPAPDLPPTKRFITSHTPEGVSHFKPEDIGDHIRIYQGGSGVANHIYSTRGNPVDMTDEKDLKLAAEKEPNLHYHDGTVVRYIDFAPGVESPMHRALSLDYGVVIEGEMKVTLDSGESQILKRGDVLVQRGTAHMWTNMSKEKSGRMLFVLLDMMPLDFGKGPLKQYLGELESDYVGRA